MARGRGAPRIGLALAGGGPEGAIWEIGALRALDEAVDGLDLNALDVYLGVSAGSFLAANLANGLRSDQMCRAIVKHEPGEHPFSPEIFFTPALGELTRRGLSVPRLVAEAVSAYVANPRDRTLLDSLTRLSRALPVGAFDNEPIRQYLRSIYSIKGRTDDFRKLGHKLFVVAADLERGQPVVFGSPGWDHVPVSRAIQASSALPGLYAPVEIDGRHFVDGVLLKTLHASVALAEGVDLLFCINPIVPVDVSQTERLALADDREFDLELRGLPTVLSQTFRTLIHSRLVVGMKAYGKRFPKADVLLFEPDRADYKMFFTNVFSFSARRRVAAHAYRSTRQDLLERADELQPLLRERGMSLNMRILEDETRDLWECLGLPGAEPSSAVQRTIWRLDRALDRAERELRPKRGAGPRGAPR